MIWRSGLAVLAGITSLWLLSAPAAAESVSMDGYCKTHYGSRARAVMLDRDDAYSWRCQVGGSYYNISVQQACQEQYDQNWVAEVGDRNDAYSWSCEAGD